MSADNGIYILQSPVIENSWQVGVEYRVAHCQAIENIEHPRLGKYWEVVFFKSSLVYPTKLDALKRASDIEDEILQSEYPVLEYGIRTLIQQEPFPTLPFSGALPDNGALEALHATTVAIINPPG